MANTTIETVKPLIYEIGDKTYTLEFSRNSVKFAESIGLTMSAVTEMETPATTIPLLFFAAFKMHHPEISRSDADKILVEDLGGIEREELRRLIELYCSPTTSLFHSEGAERKNVKVSF